MRTKAFDIDITFLDHPERRCRIARSIFDVDSGYAPDLSAVHKALTKGPVTAVRDAFHAFDVEAVMTESSMPEDHVHSRPSPQAAMPDAHGQAALLLAESTLHALLDAGVLTHDQVIEAVIAAAEVKIDVADELGDSDARMKQSLALLTAIKVSFDSDGQPPGLHIV